MFGQLIYNSRLGEKAYAEYLLADEHGVRVVACALSGAVKLFRLEWEDAILGLRNMAIYDLVEAMQEFQKLADSQLPVWLDQAIERQEKVASVKNISPLTDARAKRAARREARKAAKAAQEANGAAEKPSLVLSDADATVAEVVVQETIDVATQAAPKRHSHIAAKAARATGQQIVASHKAGK